MTVLSAWPIRRVFQLMAVLTTLAGLTTASTVLSTHHSQTAQRQMYDVTARAKDQVRSIQTAGVQMISDNTAARYIPGVVALSGKAETADAAQIQFLVKQAAQLAVPTADQHLIMIIGARYRDLQAFLTGTIQITSPTQLAQVTAQYETLIGAAAKAVNAALSALSARGAHLESQIASSGRLANVVTVALCLLTAVVVGGLILLYGRRINRSVSALHDALGRVTAGDLTVAIPVHGRDELAQMASAVVGLRDRLKTVFGHLVVSSQRLGEATTELTGMVTDVGRSAEEMSEQMEGVSNTAREVSANIQHVAAGSHQMGSSITEIARSAYDAAAEATQAVTAVNTTTTTMNQLSESSREIGDVVRLITSIAEQTNLLALNATIEAARAGDAGKGFAVVADEVKQLAQETARATGDIARRVEAIQSDAVEAVNAIVGVAGVITRINELQATIASEVEEQTATTRTINTGVNQAASGSTQIAGNIVQAARNAAVTAESMTRGTVNAGTLSAMRTELDELIASFRLV